MLEAGSVEALLDKNGIKRLSAAGSCQKRWNHWCGLGCLKSVLPHGNHDIPYIREEEEEVYVRKLGDLVDTSD